MIHLVVTGVNNFKIRHLECNNAGSSYMSCFKVQPHEVSRDTWKVKLVQRQQCE